LNNIDFFYKVTEKQNKKNKNTKKSYKTKQTDIAAEESEAN